MLSDSSEPLQFVSGEWILLFLEPVIWGGGHFYVAYQFVSMAWPYQSKKGAGNVELHFLKKT